MASPREQPRDPVRISHAWPRLMLSGGAINVECVGFDMQHCSHITNIRASGNVRTYAADRRGGSSYYTNMAQRRGIPKVQPAWYLREWMEAVGMTGRGAQARLEELTGWSKATTSQLLNGKQDLNSQYLADAANALKVEQHELLMHPESAMALRQMRRSAEAIVRVDRLEVKSETRDRATGTDG